MAVAPERQTRPRFLDKARLQRVVAEQDRIMGFVPHPDATPETIRAKMRACGVRAEDNLFSREIVAMREE